MLADHQAPPAVNGGEHRPWQVVLSLKVSSQLTNVVYVSSVLRAMVGKAWRGPATAVLTVSTTPYGFLAAFPGPRVQARSQRGVPCRVVRPGLALSVCR